MQNKTRQPPYEQRLRTIGARLDTGGYHSVSIVEVDGGLIVRASAPGSRNPEVLEITDVDTSSPAQLSRMRSGVPHRLFPDGYKGFLAALGRRLDRSEAAAISIVEGTDFVTVGGIRPVAEADGEIAFEPLDILLLASDIDSISTLPVEPEESNPEAPDDLQAPAGPGHRSITGNLANKLSSVIDSALRTAAMARNPARTRS